MIHLYCISATRSDGLECSGMIECDETQVERETLRTFRPLKVYGRIACAKHGKKSCGLHIGETLTFSNHSFQEEAL